MTNDLSTLSGALLEMKDELIYQLGQKGVTASYSSTDGLLGLIGKIADIQTGGGSCYHIEFSEASYTATGGSATLEIMLQENYQPKASATVTVTGSDSSSYTGTTNSSGIATVTVTGLTATTTFTCSYSNVSDTCSVEVSSYLFFDACNSAGGLTNYGTARNARNNNSYSASLSVIDSSYYTVTQTTNAANGFIPITPLEGEEDIKISMETYTPSGGNTGIGLIIWNSTNERLALSIQDDGSFYRVSLINGTTTDRQISSLGLANKWITQEYSVDATNNSITGKIYNDSNTLVYTYTDTLKLSIGSSTQYGIVRQWNSGSARIRNIKAESL